WQAAHVAPVAGSAGDRLGDTVAGLAARVCRVVRETALDTQQFAKRLIEVHRRSPQSVTPFHDPHFLRRHIRPSTTSRMPVRKVILIAHSAYQWSVFMSAWLAEANSAITITT